MPLLLSTFLALFVGQVHATEACRSPHHWREWNLSEQAGQRICEAAEYFNIDLLRKGSQTIVLVGETHIKGISAVRSGQRLLSEFQLRGVELLKDKDGLEEGFWLRRRTPLFKLPPSVRSWLKVPFIASGSTIDDATASDYFLYYDLENDKDMLYMKSRWVQQLSNGENGPSLTSFSPAAFASFVDVAKIRDRAETVTIHLERKRFVWEVWRRNCKERSLFSAACDDLYILDYRNDEMVDEIMRSIDLFSSLGPIVVVVGAAHVKGMRERLVCMERFQFHRVTRGLSGPALDPRLVDEASRRLINSDLTGPERCFDRVVTESW